MTDRRPRTPSQHRGLARLSLLLVLGLLLGLGWTDDGAAQSGAAAPRVAQDGPAPPPPPPPPPGSEGADTEPEEPWTPTFRPPASSKRPEMQFSAYLAVPFWLDVDRDIVRPMTSLEGIFGVSFGWFVAELEAGFSWTPIDLNELVPGSGQDPLQNFWFGLGGRFQIPNSSIVTPFLSAAFDFAFWNFRETSFNCGIWYCNSRAVFRFAPGITGRIGATFRAGAKVSIDVGADLGMTFEGNFFDQIYGFIGPFAGITLYPDAF